MNARALEFLIPGDLQAQTGGYRYDRKIIEGLRALGWQVRVHTLEPSFPHPCAAALDHAHGVLAGLREQALVLIDGLALGAMPGVAQAHSARLALIGLVHMPLATQIGLTAADARRLQQSERQALQAVRHVVVTSRRTQAALLAYGVALERLSVVEPATDAVPLARGHGGQMVKMLCVATINPGKGHDLLIEALAPLAPLPWHLTCVGSLTRSPSTVRRLRAQLRHTGIAERVSIVGEMRGEAVADCYLDADLFVLPTRFETYGMAVAEALAFGLPVISTTTGAIAELVGAEAGLLVPPGDTGALHAALARALSEPALRASMRAGAATVRRTLSRWPQACARLSRILEAIADPDSCRLRG